MNKRKKDTKKMLSRETIYKIMQWLPVIVCSLFFVKNIVGGNTKAMIIIGICLAAFVGTFAVLKVVKADTYVKELVSAIALPFLVFIISLNSGASYSDDFSLYLAVIALAGLYLEPKFTKIQIAIISVILVIMYIAHPEKAESLGQYILCIAVFILAACLVYQVIKRGRAFIEVSDQRAGESEKLLETVRTMGTELERDFSASSAKIETSTQGLHSGSLAITQGAREVFENCDVVRGRIEETEAQISYLNKDVKHFESVLGENRNHVDSMNEQVNTVSEIINESGQIFRTMEEQMNEVAGIAKQINDISFKLTILSLNASVEAAHVGESGAGFQVLASEMRELSEISTGFSTQVSEVVEELLQRVAKTSERLTSGEEALSQSEKTMSGLVKSMEELNQQFEQLYGNIERQNDSVNQINRIFNNLSNKVSDMHTNSMANQESVESIVEAMMTYRDSVDKIVKNTQSV